MFRTVIEPIDFAVFLAEDVSPKARSAIVAEFAAQQLAEVEAMNAKALGRPLPHQRFVDGVEGAPLDRVKPDGTIIFEFDVALDVFAWISDLLKSVSPVLSGRYAGSHEFYADGALADPSIPPIGQVFQFISAVPYAGKIEGEDGTPDSKQAPNGVYQVVAAMVAKRFPSFTIEFAFINGRPSITVKAR